LGLGWSFFDFAILPSVLLVRIVSALDQQHHQDREIFQRKATHEVDQIPPTRTEAEELRLMILLLDPAAQEEVLICHLLGLITWRRACAT